MADAETVRMMIFPRFSSLVGAIAFRSAPIRTRGYSAARFALWRGSGTGSSVGATYTIETSEDLRYWIGDSPTTFGTGESAANAGLESEWMRFVVTLSGTNPAVPLWVQAEFTRRGA